jgi:hypothetical protein
MARSRYSQVKFYGDMKEALAPSKVTPIKYVRPTSIGSGAEAAGVVGERLLAAYLAKQKKDAEAADIKAAGAMLDKFYAPQEEWNEEEYGSTPDTLRAATMPGALTADVGSQEMPIESYGAMGPDGMPAALGAPNAALGAPIDIEQPYAVGTDEEGDDANWMTPAEHKEFYENEALNAQTEFDAENVPGLPAVMEADRGGAYNTPEGVRGPRADAMLAALRGEDRALGMEEAERDRTLATTIAKEKRQQADELKRIEYKNKFPSGTSGTTAAMMNFAERQRLERLYPAGEDGVPSPEVQQFDNIARPKKFMNAGGTIVSLGGVRGGSDSVVDKTVPPEQTPEHKAFVASKVKAAEQAIKVSGEAYASLRKISTNIANIDESIAALDDGANTGPFAKYAPSITAASVELDNLQRRMGLDVIGSVTFGALSKGELDLALAVALPTSLRPPELREWLVKKRSAQSKLSNYLGDAAVFLGRPGNNVAKWVEMQEKSGSGNVSGMNLEQLQKRLDSKENPPSIEERNQIAQKLKELGY